MKNVTKFFCNYILMPVLMIVCLALVIVWGFLIDQILTRGYLSGDLPADVFGLLLVTVPFIILIKHIWSKVESINVDQFISQSYTEVLNNIFKQKIILYTGPTGSGKSHSLNSIIDAVMANFSPKKLKILCIDSKKSGLETEKAKLYLYNEIIWDPDQAIAKLNEAVIEFSRKENNSKLIILVDEVGDIMNWNGEDFESLVSAIDESDNIYLVMTTSRPSSQVLSPKLMSFVRKRVDLLRWTYS